MLFEVQCRFYEPSPEGQEASLRFVVAFGRHLPFPKTQKELGSNVTETR